MAMGMAIGSVLLALLVAGDAAEPNLLKDTSFELLGDADSPWSVESQDGAKLSASKFKQPDGSAAAKLTVDSVGTELWHAQFFQQGVVLEANKAYEVSVKMKAAESFDAASPPSVDLTVLRASPPWTTVAVRSCALSPGGQTFVLKFTPTEDVANARVTISTGKNDVDFLVWSPVLVAD